MQRGGSSASFYPCLLLSMPLPTRASCYPCLPQSFPPTTLHRASPRAPQGEAAGCWPSLQGVGVKAVWLTEEGNASWASPHHHFPCTPMVLLARMQAPALSTLLAPSRSAPSDGQAEAAQCQAWITGGVSKMKGWHHSPEFQSEPCPVLLCPRQAAPSLLGSCWPKLQEPRHSSHGSEPRQPEHQSIACKLLSKETARGSEVARCNYKRGRLHSLMNQLN